MRRFVSFFRSSPPRWLNGLIRRVWIGAALFALVGIGALALRAAPIAIKSASPVAFLAAGDAPTPTDTPPVPTDTPIPAPTATTAPPTATPAPLPTVALSFASIDPQKAGTTNGYTVFFTVQTSPAAPDVSFGFNTTYCGARGERVTGVLDGSGRLSSSWFFKSSCADAPFTVDIVFDAVYPGHHITGSTSIQMPAWS